MHAFKKNSNQKKWVAIRISLACFDLKIKQKEVIACLSEWSPTFSHLAPLAPPSLTCSNLVKANPGALEMQFFICTRNTQCHRIMFRWWGFYIYLAQIVEVVFVMYPLVIGSHAIRSVGDVSDVHTQAVVEFPLKELQEGTTWSETLPGWKDKKMGLLSLII